MSAKISSVADLATGSERPGRPPAIIADLDLRGYAAASGAEPDSSAAADGPAWAELSAEARRSRLLKELRTIVASEMKLSGAALDPRRPLRQYGLESIMALGIRRRLEALTGLRLPATLVWNRPSLNALADDLAERLGAAHQDSARAEPVGGSALDGLLAEFEDELAAGHA